MRAVMLYNVFHDYSNFLIHENVLNFCVLYS